MFNADHIAKVPTEGTETTAPSTAINTTTKDELLSRARAAIEAGEQSMLDAAEALGLAKEEHSATQREMADAVGKSPAWVNALLKWRESGYKDASPFDRPRLRLAAKQFGKATATSAEADTDGTGADTPTDTSSATSGSDAELLKKFKRAVDSLMCRMSPETKQKALVYAQRKAGVSVF